MMPMLNVGERFSAKFLAKRGIKSPKTANPDPISPKDASGRSSFFLDNNKSLDTNEINDVHYSFSLDSRSTKVGLPFACPETNLTELQAPFIRSLLMRTDMG